MSSTATPSLLSPLIRALLSHDRATVHRETHRLFKEHAGTASLLLMEMTSQLYARGAWDALVIFYETAVDALPETALHAMAAQAREMTDRGYLQHAITLLELARRRSPGDPGLLQQLARRYQMVGEDAKAIGYLERIVAIDPQQKDWRFMYSVARMIQSRFMQGIEDYDTRFDVFPDQRRPVSIPRWKGESLAGKRFYIWSEQGVGDLIMYAGFLPYLLSQKPKEICMGVPSRMVATMARSFPNIRWVAQETGQPCPEDTSDLYDFSMPAADMLRYCFPHYAPREQGAFLKADSGHVEQSRQWLASLGGKRKIGISWCTTSPMTGIVRNIPLHLWAPIFSVPNCVFVSMQHGDNVATIVEQFRAETRYPLFVDPSLDPIRDFDRLVGLAAALDEIICIQVTAGHIGGALGIPTTVLRSKALDFSWAFEPCPWYASVHIEKQEKALEWTSVTNRVGQTLRQRSAIASAVS